MSQGNSKTYSILIAGCSSGIGEHLFDFFKKENYYEVWGCSRYANNDPCHIKADCMDETQVRKLIKYCRPDILINCVGQASMNSLLLSSMETYSKVVNNNLVSTFLLCREAARGMRTRGWGRIVNFGSCTCSMFIEGESLYTASKSGIVAFSRCAAKELGPDVTVNCISPGPVNTRLIESVPSEKIEKILDQQIIKKLTTHADILNVVNWLISENSAAITGQNIYLNGSG